MQHPPFLFDSKGKAGEEIETDRERGREGNKERKQRDDKGAWILL